MKEQLKLHPFGVRHSWRYFGGGGGSLPEVSEPVSPPLRIEPEIEKAKSDLREKLRRRKGRADSMTGFGLYDIEAPTYRPLLSEKLG